MVYEEEDPITLVTTITRILWVIAFPVAGVIPILVLPSSGIYYQRPDVAIRLGDTYVELDPDRRIVSITQQIIDESTQGQEVVECGRFKVIVKYEVGCPPPDHTLALIGHIGEDATLESSNEQLINTGTSSCALTRLLIFTG